LASGFAEGAGQEKRGAKRKAGMICPHCGRHIGGTPAGRSGIDDLEEDLRAKIVLVREEK